MCTLTKCCENCANAIMTDSGLFDCLCHEMILPPSGSCDQWTEKADENVCDTCTYYDWWNACCMFDDECKMH